MNEWYHDQKKLGSDFLNSLKERLDKSNQCRRELSREEKTKLSKLVFIADKLKSGKNVQNRQLQTWLSVDEYAQLDAEWQEQLELREELKHKPSDLKRYEEKLKQATFNYNRAEGYSSKGKHSTAKKFYNSSESHCEGALEILQGIVAADASLHMWFDRGLDFGHGSLVDAQLGNLPRVITSRSLDRKTTDSRLMSRSEVKIAAVEWQ